MDTTPNKILKDTFNRRLSYLRLSVTDLCNFRCNYCLPQGYTGKVGNELNLTEIENLIQGFADLGTQKIRLTGGEPSLRKDITDIIRICKTPKSIKKLAITTNGWRLQQQYKSWIDAGLDQINLSIDSLDKKIYEQITGKNSLDKILTTVDKILAEDKISLKINAVLLKDYGAKQFSQALEFVKNRAVNIRFIELMQTGDNEVFFRQNHLTTWQIKTYLEQNGWQVLPKDKDSGPALEYYHADYAGKLGIIAPYSKDFCTICNRLRITSTGKLHLCLFDSTAFDIREFLQDKRQADFLNYVQNIVFYKPQSHYLQDKKVGLVKHLAMIGG